MSFSPTISHVFHFEQTDRPDSQRTARGIGSGIERDASRRPSTLRNPVAGTPISHSPDSDLGAGFVLVSVASI